MNRLIFLNRFFFPDHSATSQILSDLAFHLAASEREVHVITGRQLYDDPQAQLPAEEIVEGDRGRGMEAEQENEPAASSVIAGAGHSDQHADGETRDRVERIERNEIHGRDKASFQSRCHFFNCFSRSIAGMGSLKISKYTSLSRP
jgi:hypothetical protein